MDLKTFKESNEVLHAHKDCKRKFTNTTRQSTFQLQLKNLSMGVTFDWKCFCFFCSSKVDFFNKDRNKPRRFMRINIKNNVLKADENCKDELGQEVFGKLTGCNDLVPEGAVYHSACIATFSKKTNLGKVGRSIKEEKICSFEIMHE